MSQGSQLQLEFCASCNAPIWWVVTESGKRMPVDHKPVDDGNIIFINKMAHVITAGESVDPDIKRWKSHFATCPNAKTRRKKVVDKDDTNHIATAIFSLDSTTPGKLSGDEDFILRIADQEMKGVIKNVAMIDTGTRVTVHFIRNKS